MPSSISRLLVGVAGLTLAAASVTSAEEAVAPHDAGRGDLFLKVATGLGLTEDSDLDIRQSDPAGDSNLTFHDVSWEDNSLSGPSARYTTVRFGYFTARKPWLGVAVEFMHFKVFAEVERSLRVTGTDQGVPIDAVQPMNAIVERYIVGNGVNFLTASFLARKRLHRSERYPNGRLQPYVGVGAGPTFLYTSSTVHGKKRGGPYELGGIGLAALGGVQLHVGRHWDLFAEYKRSYTQANGSIDDGSSRTDLHTNHYTVGAGIHF
jgi:opacity protein-like surface antigen